MLLKEMSSRLYLRLLNMQQPFLNLGKAFKKFFEDLKKGIVSYPNFKKKKDNEGSFYIGGDQVSLSYTNRNSVEKR